MGDRFYITINCAYCDEENEAYYADSSEITDFTCKKCKKKSEIIMGFTAKMSNE